MENKLLHTPDGVRDLYGKECSDKLLIIERIHKIFNQYGYNDIQTPSFEFFEVFSEERGSVPSNDLYKFFDREGNTMVLRPDMTPPVARFASKFFNEDNMPVRLCYNGNIFINNNDLQGKLKEQTQMGAELVCEPNATADAEMVAMVVECMKASGLKEFQVELGQVDFFKGIIEEAGISDDVKDDIIKLIERKNFFGIEDALKEQGVSEEYWKVFAKLPELFGDVSVLDEAKVLTKNKKALDAIDNLLEIYEIIKSYGLESYISFDLGMLSNYEYYTGVIFKGYTYGASESLVGGGRYNNLIKQFGKDAPSVGFGINIDGLILSMERQKIEIDNNSVRRAVIYNSKDLSKAIQIAKGFREKGEFVVLIDNNIFKNEEMLAGYVKRNRISDVTNV